MSDEFAAAVRALKAARRVTVLTSQYMSQEAGVLAYWELADNHGQLPDDGTANSYAEGKPVSVAWYHNPGKVWDWYEARRAQMSTAKPHRGHFALIQMADRFEDFTLITGNEDDLHERAGSRDVIHLFGRIFETKCFFNCRAIPTLVDPKDFVVRDESPPACPYCGRWLRPNVIWEDDQRPIDEAERALQASLSCDVMLLVGVSHWRTMPAYPVSAGQAGVTLVEISLDRPKYSFFNSIPVYGTSKVVLPQLLEALDA